MWFASHSLEMSGTSASTTARHFGSAPPQNLPFSMLTWHPLTQLKYFFTVSGVGFIAGAHEPMA